MGIPEIKEGFRYFPVRAGEKAPPLIADWPRQASADPEQLQRWAQQYPDANWAVTLDNGFVIDVDPKRGGDATLLALELDDILIPACPTVATPSTGEHYYLELPGGTRTGVDVLGPGVDIRGRGGYALVPPSVVAGTPYRWLRNGPMPPAPAALVARLRPPKTEAPTAPPVDLSRIDQETAVQRAREALRHHPSAVEGQGGDAQTFRAACIARDHGVAPERMLEALEDWNARCEPPWDLLDLHRKTVNAYRYASGQAGAKMPIFDRVPAVKGLRGPQDVHRADSLRTRYLIKGWLDKGTLAMLFGAPTSGKTFATLHMMAHVAGGVPWGGMRVRQAGVLYAVFEGHDKFEARVDALRDATPEIDWSTLPLRWWLATTPLVRKGVAGRTEGQAALERQMEGFRKETGAWPGVLVLDVLREALGGSDSDVELTAPLIEYCRGLSLLLGLTVLLIHHPGHGAQDRGRGDSGIRGALDNEFRLNRDLNVLSSTKQRDNALRELAFNLRPVTLGMDEDGDPMVTCVFEIVTGRTLTTPEERMLTRLREVAVDGQISVKQARTVFPDMKSDVREPLLASLRLKRYLVQGADGGWDVTGGAETWFDETES